MSPAEQPAVLSPACLKAASAAASRIARSAALQERKRVDAERLRACAFLEQSNAILTRLVLERDRVSLSQEPRLLKANKLHTRTEGETYLPISNMQLPLPPPPIARPTNDSDSDTSWESEETPQPAPSPPWPRPPPPPAPPQSQPQTQPQPCQGKEKISEASMCSPSSPKTAEFFPSSSPSPPPSLAASPPVIHNQPMAFAPPSPSYTTPYQPAAVQRLVDALLAEIPHSVTKCTLLYPAVVHSHHSLSPFSPFTGAIHFAFLYIAQVISKVVSLYQGAFVGAVRSPVATCFR
ncbi:hypothetical protein RI054_02g13320 [Pseudoscourfieldia marina]